MIVAHSTALMAVIPRIMKSGITTNELSRYQYRSTSCSGFLVTI